jgi:SAM-dependent methyltransferase
MATAHREKWNSKYTARTAEPASPPEWFTRHLSFLRRGSALDLATGRGATAIELATHGWQVTAVDISDVAIASAAKAARGRGVHVDWILADLDTFPLPADRFDVITAFYYLDRHLPAQLVAALRPGGTLVYETFTVNQLRIPGNHLTNPEHMLQSGELLSMFQSLRVRAYREINLSDRAIAGLVAEKASR